MHVVVQRVGVSEDHELGAPIAHLVHVGRDDAPPLSIGQSLSLRQGNADVLEGMDRLRS